MCIRDRYLCEILLYELKLLLPVDANVSGVYVLSLIHISPVDHRFKKQEVKGVSAKVIKAAMLGGDVYPATAIRSNLPNSNWIRSVHGSKSVTSGNLTDAYNKAAHGNGVADEFV